MKFTTTMIASVLLLGVSLTASNTSMAQSSCDGPTTHKLMVHTHNDKMPYKVTKGAAEEDAFDLLVCIGDTIEWKIVGSGRRFFVRFDPDTPFNGGGETTANSNGKISIVVGDTATIGAEYKYSIGLGDKLWDPKIVIAR
jgi:hypothetical protein